MTAYDDLMAHQRDTQALAQVAGRQHWDQETMMPRGAAAQASGAPQASRQNLDGPGGQAGKGLESARRGGDARQPVQHRKPARRNPRVEPPQDAPDIARFQTAVDHLRHQTSPLVRTRLGDDTGPGFGALVMLAQENRLRRADI
ncbi:MAG: hypothetical protein RI571_08235, partial [Roseovarius sp.]|nr:hypothetical protein [Roseovarius sp.]